MNMNMKMTQCPADVSPVSTEFVKFLLLFRKIVEVSLVFFPTLPLCV